MFARLLKFELSLHTKQIGFWVAAIIVFLVGFSITSLDWLSLGGNSGGERIKANGAINIASYSNLFSYIAIFFGAVFVVTGVMRDDVHKSLEIVHATPVTTSAMIWSRFAGVWAVTSLCVLAGVIGMAVGTLAPWADKETFAPFNLLHYIQPFFLFVVINTLFVTAFYTSIAAVTRNRSMVYISAVGLLMLTQMAGLLTLQSENDWLNSLISPFGDSAMDTVTEYWPPDEQNNRMVPLMGFIGANRLLWGGLSIAALLLSRRLFTRGIVSGKFKGVLADEGEPARLGSVSFASAKTQYGFGSRLSQFWTRFKYETLTTLRSTPFIILSLIGLIFFGITVYVTAMMSPEPVLPISSQLATIVTGGFSLFIYIIMIFFAGEIIWRDRIVGMTEILDATPTRNGVFMASKWASLMAIIAAALLFAIVCGMAIQLGIHRTPVEPMVFLKSIFIAVGTPLFLFAALILMIQSLSPGRVIGMIISAVAMIGLLVFAVQFPHGHPLMNYGMVSTGGFSDMNGFRNMTRYGWFLLYWGCLVGLFAVLSIWLWRRGVEVGLIARIKSIRSRMSLISIGAALASLIGFTAVGTSLYNAYDAKGFTTERQDELAFVAYENSLWEKAFDPAPGVISVRSDVQFYPEKGTAKITGTYALENRYDVPITEFYVGGRHYDELKSISIKGASQQDEAFDEVIRPKRKPAKKGDEDETEVEADTAPLETKPSEYTLKDFGYRRFVFATPLAPGARTQMDFTVEIEATEIGRRSPIIPNGTFVDNTRIFPVIGLSNMRMRNPDKRRKYDLPKLSKMKDREDMEARSHNFFTYNDPRVNFETRFCTEPGQIAIAPGNLVREYEDNGRACFDYKTQQPIANFFAFVSANFLESTDAHKGVKLRILYHKSHPYNVEKMMDALKSGLDSYAKSYGPYQYDHVRIMEFPYRSFAQSFAGTIPFSERIGFIQDNAIKDGETIDLMTYVTLHELGHQYFGHQIFPAQVKGFNVLSETLSENSASSALEDLQGWEAAKRRRDSSANHPINGYLAARTADKNAERPLALVENSPYTWYNKGHMVFWGLRGYMGREAVDGAMQDLIAQYGLKEGPYPTTLDLVSALRARGDDDVQQFITDSFDKLTFWDLKIKDESVTANSDGGYDVSFTLQTVKKYASEETGKEEETDLAEFIEIGVFSENPSASAGGEALVYKRIPVTEEETKVTITVSEKPSHVMADPRAWLIERNVKDNAVKLEEAASTN